jgi:hypothetical protein
MCIFYEPIRSLGVSSTCILYIGWAVAKHNHGGRGVSEKYWYLKTKVCEDETLCHRVMFPTFQTVKVLSSYRVKQSKNYKI